LFEAGALTGALAQEVQPGAADLGMAFDNYFLDARRAGQESALYTDTIAGYATDGEIAVVPAAAQADDGATELLDALIGAFL